MPDPNQMTDAELQTAIEQQSTTATGDPVAPPPEPESYEYKTATGQVYKGKTKDEVIAAVLKAQENATLHIKEQHDKIKDMEAKLQTQVQPATPVNGGFQKKRYYELLEEDPLQAQDYLDGFRPQYGRVMGAVEKFEYGLQAQEFIRRVPEFEDSQENATALFTRLKMENRPFTADNMQLVYHTLQSEGVIKNAPAEPPRPATPNPPPVMGGASGQASELANIDAEVSGMTDAQFEDYLRKKGIPIV